VQKKHLVELHATGEHISAEMAELSGVGRSTVYGAVRCARQG
jgi:hypothetical protein